MREAEPKLNPTIDRIAALMKHSPNATLNIRQVAQHLMALLESKHRLIAQVQSGNSEDVFRYVESGRGIALSDSPRDELRLFEDDWITMYNAWWSTRHRPVSLPFGPYWRL